MSGVVYSQVAVQKGDGEGEKATGDPCARLARIDVFNDGRIVRAAPSTWEFDGGSCYNAIVNQANEPKQLMEMLDGLAHVILVELTDDSGRPTGRVLDVFDAGITNPIPKSEKP